MAQSGNVQAADLTLEEKASLASGSDFWHTNPVERVGVPPIMLTDGPHGLRKQTGASDALGLADSVPATCFPPAVGLGAAFDPELAERVGAALGEEAAIEDVAVLLGPGINIKRTPLGGRNFEYLSEDPLVAGEVGAALVRGIQSRGVGASLKHFAANNQETDRLRVSSDIDPRPLHEIYLRAFERVVKQARPWTVMCSYNRVNGVYASENRWLLTELLREDWGFDGLVVSDWGAVSERVPGVRAGLDLEMPGSGGRTDAEIVAAVRSGELDEADLDKAAQRVLDLVARAQQRSALPGPLDVDAHHALAREAAGRSIVLLRNQDAQLPLAPERKLAVIGAFAADPRYQGAGSSQIHPTRLDTALDAIREAARGDVSYAQGFPHGGSGDDDAAALRDEAVRAASVAETAVVFLGVPAAEESEGFDRDRIDLPGEQLDLLDAVLAACPETVVVLSHGGVVAVPFADRVPAILDASLLGQAGGSATADVLYGAVNPSGRLAETIPLRLEDNPSHGNFPGELGHVRYGEGLLVGYRGYDARRLDVRYPFGHGLSYTTFAYGDARADVEAGGDVRVTVPVTNTGSRDGREVVQVYASLPGSVVQRPPRELAAFASVEIAAGQTADVELTVHRADLAYRDVRVDRFVVEGGEYALDVGASSRDLRTRASAAVDGDEVRIPLSLNSTIDELLADPVIGADAQAALDEQGLDASTFELVRSFPVGRIDGTPLPRDVAVALVEKAQRAD